MSRNKLNRFSHSVLIICMLISFFSVGSVSASLQKQTIPEQQAKEILSKMSPEEKVGQLFLVTFKGRQVDQSSQIYDLIVNHTVGGVILRAENDNFTGPVNTIDEAYQMISSLQNEVWEVSQNNEKTPEPARHEYIPLFIGMAQEGDGEPHDQILTGLTQLPNEMAIGATWQPQLAQQIGQVLGSELSTLGVNLLLGPSLDVLEVNKVQSGVDLGTRTFGGDPFWVGEMGKAYIKGVHEGSNNRIAVIAKHFPGRGGSDRPPDEEIATVRKSLEQLKQIELAPFFAVTGNAPDVESTTDGLLVSHIRYQGFQGNIRATTRPVSFDSAAFEQIMGLSPFSAWRSAGGVIVSDDLGSQAVRRFFDPTGQSFDARQVARNSFLAGNDLLYVDNFIATGDPDTYTTIVRTLEFFTQKYREDPAFAQRVDASVERVLALKFKVFGNFDIAEVVPAKEGLSTINQSQQVVFDVAQHAVTLISPDAGELPSTLQRPPENRDRIVFITDIFPERQCRECVEQTPLQVDALQKAIVRLYGPTAGEQVLQYKLSSYSFTDLTDMLNGAPDLPPVEEDIRSADWLVFAMLNYQPSREKSGALRRFLSERPDLLTNKRIVTFAFNAPYYLDATDISKLSAYYGLYSKAPAFVDVAARVLFQELTPLGALPVSVSGVGYDLITATSPDPNQVIALYLDSETLVTAPTSLDNELTALPTEIPLFRVGDVIPLKTGMIRDHNNHLVPDGTVVRFLFNTGGELGTTQQTDTVTQNGVARTTFRIQSPGMLEIRVNSDPAFVSGLLRLDISTTQAAAITVIAPTPVQTDTPQPTETVTPTQEPTATPVPEPPVERGFGYWLLSVLLIWGGAAGIFFFDRENNSMRWAVRSALLAVIGGFLIYILFSSGIIGGENWLQKNGWVGVSTIVLVGVLTGWGSSRLWQLLRNRLQRKNKGKEEINSIK